MCCSVLQCVAVCCSVILYYRVSETPRTHSSRLQLGVNRVGCNSTQVCHCERSQGQYTTVYNAYIACRWYGCSGVLRLFQYYHGFCQDHFKFECLWLEANLLGFWCCLTVIMFEYTWNKYYGTTVHCMLPQINAYWVTLWLWIQLWLICGLGLPRAKCVRM